MRPSLLSVPAAVLTAVVVGSGAHAAPVQGATLTNSPKGFIGCLSEGPVSSPTSTVYCVAMQVPSSGAEAGRLSTDAWVCRYTMSGGTLLSDRHVVLAPSKLQVRPNGSFAFTGRLPGIGLLSIVASGGESEPYAAPPERVDSAAGPRQPQGYTLVSPADGLSTYRPDLLYPLPPTPLTDPRNHLVSASVGGHRQSTLFGSVWHSPTSGEWDFESC
jgi:hypothetical protein